MRKVLLIILVTLLIGCASTLTTETGVLERDKQQLAQIDNNKINLFLGFNGLLIIDEELTQALADINRTSPLLFQQYTNPIFVDGVDILFSSRNFQEDFKMVMKELGWEQVSGEDDRLEEVVYICLMTAKGKKAIARCESDTDRSSMVMFYLLSDSDSVAINADLINQVVHTLVISSEAPD